MILLHGYTNNAESWIWNGVFAELAKRYHVIAPDCRGHGESGKPHTAEQYGREMSRDVLRLLDALGIDRAHIIGYSLGAQITAQMVASSPERFRTAILGVQPDGGNGRRPMSCLRTLRRLRWNSGCCDRSCCASPQQVDRG